MDQKIRGVLFDLDGVLVDTAKYHYQAWSKLAESLGFSFSEEDNERLKGVSRAACLEILLTIGNVSLTEKEKEEAMAGKNANYVDMISHMSPRGILPGVLELLKELQEAGIKTALGSASRNAPIILEKTGLKDYLDAVVDGNRTTQAKPNPEVFLLGASDLNLKPEECVVFEDAAAGIEAGIAGGMLTVGIGHKDQLGAADALFPDLNGISWQMIKDSLEAHSGKNKEA
ncbi:MULTISPECIES: beta-phosphoglucomutase [unclassified Oceanispirochaeta]|uniref:beta-phosphoglucomutase n=1 Tax=unclassified Oceanispirochaeta TaxID=2635722 RepID=UPI000E08D7C9|nr:MULTISPECIES: beta-phosphoglucomutase [unclassified Oceanispirochaeta]MBF9016925.1 beta-phosphoglucomutase [Oceanispirochaeta sp. M2]NPD73288.1 beta-phosphoglucomutase [Oceanispirochaeta sp. M1]RDG30951.1 beta-phosphoglucomutase [Oceanispirochaeta sp. M1]